MKHYNTLLFDVDNTLLDFDANEADSFKRMMEEKGEPFSTEIYRVYKTMNEELWRAIERGEAAVDEVVNSRFAILMGLYGKEVDGVEWENTYRRYLNQGIQEVPGVHRVLSSLKQTHNLYVITNGIEETQKSRMKRSGLDRYFTESFISQSIGAGKPSKEFFEYVEGHIPGFDRKKTLIIGDSLTSDIRGGRLAGIDTCWFCKDGTENLYGETPTYVIHRLEDLLSLYDK